MKKIIRQTRKRLAIIVWISIAGFSPLQAEDKSQQEYWPVEMSDYAAWAFKWNVGNAGTANNSDTQTTSSYIQWALRWDLDKADLTDIRKTMQWQGVPADEWVIRVGLLDGPHAPNVRNPACYRAVTKCDSA